MREAFHFAINGVCVYAEYEDTFTSQIVKPLLRKLAKLQKKAGRRIIVFLAAPPATGNQRWQLILPIYHRMILPFHPYRQSAWTVFITHSNISCHIRFPLMEQKHR